MAKAQLEITIVEKGGAPAGRGAPAPSSGGSAASARGPRSVTPGSSGTNLPSPNVPGGQQPGSAQATPPPPPAGVQKPLTVPPPPAGVQKPLTVPPQPRVAGASGATKAGSATVPQSAIGMAASSLGKLAMGAVAAYAGMKGIEKAADIAKQVWASLLNDVDSASQFNGQVATARAMTQISMQMAEMRRANQLGPQLARLEEARSEIEKQLFDVVTDIKRDILTVIVPLLEVMASGAQYAPLIADAGKEAAANSFPITAGILKLVKFFYDSKTEEESKEDMFLDAMRRAMGELESPASTSGRGGRAAGGAAAGGVSQRQMLRAGQPVTVFQPGFAE